TETHHPNTAIDTPHTIVDATHTPVDASLTRNITTRPSLRHTEESFRRGRLECVQDIRGLAGDVG
ncbi:hypothetical protein, partial [Cutibacterium porci]|uniref:hypothetical protein n=1 Tax=Cutibacterium porci TaxID=2605781 RepID=UPI001E49B473